MTKAPKVSPDQAPLFDPPPNRDPSKMFANGVPTPYKVEPDLAEAEQDIDRLDDQGQTNPTTALGRLGVGMDMVDGTIHPERFPEKTSPKRSRRTAINPRTRTARELRTADQPPEHERHDPYA